MKFASVDEIKATPEYEELSESAKNTLASLWLENLLPSTQLFSELFLLDKGVINVEEFYQRGRARMDGENRSSHMHEIITECATKIRCIH